MICEIFTKKKRKKKKKEKKCLFFDRTAEEERCKGKGKGIMVKGEVTSSDEDIDDIVRRQDAELRHVYENLDPIVLPFRRLVLENVLFERSFD